MEKELRDQLVGSYCPCYNISYNELALFVRNMKSIKSIENLTNYMAICGRCKKCHNDVQKIIDFYRNRD